MPIAASDIVAYGSAVMPDSDATEEIGGAIALTKRVVFDDIVATDSLEILSSETGDTTQEVTVHGRNAAGELVSDSAVLNGTTPVAISQVFERILKATLDGAATGNVTVRDADTDTAIMVFAPGELEIRRPFYNASAEAAGGSARTYYEKIFIRNNHATLSLTGATIAEQADPSAKVAFALESTLDGTDTNGAGNNRQVTPGGYTFNSDPKNVANSQNLTAESAQGVWLELTLGAGDAADNTSYTLRTNGNTV